MCSVYINTLFHDWWVEGATSVCVGHGCALDCTKMNKGQNVLPWKLGTKHFETYNYIINSFSIMFYSYVQEANFDV